MSKDDFGAIFVLLLLAAVFVAIGYVIGGVVGQNQGKLNLHAEAVKRGHAEYILVNGGPETKFQWKESK